MYQEAIDNGLSEISRIKSNDGSDVFILFENKKGYEDLEDNKVFYSWEMSEVEDFKESVLEKNK